MTREEFDEMMLAPNCVECNGLTEDGDGVWQCAFQGQRDTEDCYGTDYCCMLYLIQLDNDEEEEDERDYCDEADGECSCCEIADECDYAYDCDEDDEEDDCGCDCDECKDAPVEEAKEEVKPVEEIGGTI